MDWVFVPGGGRIQAPLISEYISRGMLVCVADKDPLCHAVTLEGANVHLADSHDPEACLRLVRTLEKLLGCPPVATMTAGTDVGPSVSLVAEAYNLPASSLGVAITAKDKLLMREALDLPHPWYTTVNPPAYPCVEKPRYESGSRGVKVLASQADYTWKPDYLWEEWLYPQTIASTDWMLVDGAPVYVNGALRDFHPEVFGLEVGYFNPFEIDDSIQTLANLACKAISVTEGPFKMDILRDKRYGWCILEATTRWSGSFDHTVAASLSTGRNLTKHLVDYSLGLPYTPQVPRLGSHVYVKIPSFDKPYLVTGDMIQSIKGLPHIPEVIVTRHSGGPTVTLSDRPLFIFAEGDSPELAKMRADSAWQAWLEFERTLNLGGID